MHQYIDLSLNFTMKTKRKPERKMKHPATSESRRTAALGRLLEKQREDTLMRVRDFRRGQADDVSSSPGDEMDVARSLADVETHAALIERAQERLKAIDAARALSRARCGGDGPGPRNSPSRATTAKPKNIRSRRRMCPRTTST